MSLRFVIAAAASTHGKPNRESRAAKARVADRNRAAVCVDDLLRDGKAKAGTAPLPAAGRKPTSLRLSDDALPLETAGASSMSLVMSSRSRSAFSCEDGETAARQAGYDQHSGAQGFAAVENCAAGLRVTSSQA